MVVKLCPSLRTKKNKKKIRLTSGSQSDQSGESPIKTDPVSLLIYVYCCMCLSGNAKKGLNSFHNEVCIQRECLYLSFCSNLGQGCHDIRFLVGLYIIAVILTVVLFFTAGAVAGIILITISFAKIVKRHRKLMKNE